ncbi:MAG: hypothetical protein WA374_14645 [Acidobacteriaceae bacterium]
MRTTLAIDDDVLEEVKQYAAQRDISLGKAATDLIRRGISQPLNLRRIDGIYVPVLPPNTPILTTKRLLEAEDEW